MLDLHALRVDYGPIEAVKSIDMSVAIGECVALLGPNGAGKTSVLRAVSRLERSRGTIDFDGQEIGSWTPEKAARHGLIHVPEGRHVFPNLSVHENLLVGRSTKHTASWTCTLDEVYDLFPALRRISSRSGWALSGGEQQMVAIGRGLLAGPKLLMLDEPSLGLAPVIVHEVFSALAEVRGHVSILIVEQNTAMALRFAERAYVLSHGTVALEGDSRMLASDPNLLATYLGQAEGGPTHTNEED